MCLRVCDAASCRCPNARGTWLPDGVARRMSSRSLYHNEGGMGFQARGPANVCWHFCKTYGPAVTRNANHHRPDSILSALTLTSHRLCSLWNCWTRRSTSLSGTQCVDGVIEIVLSESAACWCFSACRMDQMDTVTVNDRFANLSPCGMKWTSFGSCSLPSLPLMLLLLLLIICACYINQFYDCFHHYRVLACPEDLGV